MPNRTAISIIVTLTAALFSTLGLLADPVEIQTAHHSQCEQQEKLELEQLLKKYDVSKYTFTHTVIIEERAMNHAFPVLTLNVHFLGSDDELLSSFLHEQLHWHLAQHRPAMVDAVRQLKTMYPHAPVGLPERTDKVIKNKPWYTWIYKTILQDEDRIGALVKAEHLELDARVLTPGTRAEHLEPNGWAPTPGTAVVVMPWEMPCNEEIVKSNFEAATQQRVTGQLNDPASAAFEKSAVVLKKQDTDGKFVDYRTVVTGTNGSLI